MLHVQKNKEGFTQKFKRLKTTQQATTNYLIKRLEQGEEIRQEVKVDHPHKSKKKGSDQLFTAFIILFSLMQTGLLDVAISAVDGFT